MKKSFLIYLVALLIVTGIFGYVVWSGNNSDKANIDLAEEKMETYSSFVYGYSFNYPNFLIVSEGSEDSVTLVEEEYQEEDKPSISVSVHENINNSYNDIKEWFNSYNHGYRLLGTDSVNWLNREGLIAKAEIESYSGIFEVTEHYTFSPDKRYVYNVRYNRLRDSDSKYNEAYDQVVRSFKFGEGVIPDVFEWLTYSDSQYGYSFMYPKEFQSEETEISANSVSVSKKSIQFKVKNSADIILMSVDIYDADNLTPQKFYETKLAPSGGEIPTGTDWALENKTAYQVDSIEPRSSLVVVHNGEYMIAFSQENASVDEGELYEQILSTVSFF